MKRWMAIALSVSTFLLALCALPIAAEENSVNDWSIYIMEETEGGIPMFREPPAYEYGDRGLRVTPTEDMVSYTVQSDTPCSMDEGFFLEFEVEDVTLENTLMIHLWDQSGVLIGNYNCGSGWYTMIAIDKGGNDYMMSLAVEEASGSSAGYTDILGSMKVSTGLKGKSGTYSISVADGILRLNGAAVPGLDEALALLKAKKPDGKVYVGVSIRSFEEGVSLSPMTLTRFGADEATAMIPGTDIVPETEPVETSPVGTAPAESDTQASLHETDPIEIAPVTQPQESMTQGAVTEEPTTETEPESETAGALDQLKDVYGVASARCHSTIGASGLAYVAVVALGALLLRKKKD